jgi:hypothetical protein
MTTRFTQEQRWLHQIVLHSNDVPARGLFDGQMGIVIVLSEYVRARKARPLKTAINFLLDQVLDNLSTEMPLYFANGLTGIGWGVEYLLQNKFQRGSGADICAAIDQKLMQQNILRQTDLSLEKGLEGWLHYIVAHLQGAQRNGRQVFDAAYLQDCQSVCCNLIGQGIAPSLEALCKKFVALTNGQQVSYEFSLTSFINPTIKRNTTLLGLHDGMAGLLFNLIKS